MLKVTHILLFPLVAFVSSLPQTTWQKIEPWLSISQHIGDGIRHVPIPPPWYFLKHYRPINPGFLSTTESNRVTNGLSSDLNSKFNTVNPYPTTAKIEYGPFTTRGPIYHAPNVLSTLSTSPVTTSTEHVTYQTVSVPTYRPPINLIQPTYPSVSSELPNGSDTVNGHSKPLYTSENPSHVSEETTEISEPISNDNDASPASDSQLQTGTGESQEEEQKDQENVNTDDKTTTTPPNNTNNDENNQNNNLGFLFSGPQFCKKENAYFGVGENKSFYVECRDYHPSMIFCPDDSSFDSHVLWPENPCKEGASDETN